MDKTIFLTVLKGIVEEFEKDSFKKAMSEAQASGDVSKIIQVPTDAQNKVFSAHGVDVANGPAEFKAAGKQYGADPEATPYLDRMRKALGK